MENEAARLKIPPHSIDAEMSLLGSILLDKETLMRVVDILDPTDFYKDAHRIVYEAILDLYATHEPVDLLTVGNRLDEKKQLEMIGGRSYLVQLSNTVATAGHAPTYARIVSKKAVLRRLLSASHEISVLGFSEDQDIDTLLDEAQQTIFRISMRSMRQEFTPIRAVLTEAFDRIDELHKEKGKMRGVPSGFHELDNLLAGFQKSDLVILAARPSVGKSSFALDVVRNVATKAKVPVGLFSLEMSKEQMVDRLLCAESNVDLWRLRTGKLAERPEDDDFQRIGHAMGVLAESPIFLDDTPNCTITQIRTKARRLQSEHGLGMIVIDYLQLMDSSSHGNSDNRVQEVAEITRGLKGIARELNIPVIALSQLSRAVEVSKPAIPKLAHLRESGSIEQDADIVMFIYRKSADRNYRTEDIPPDERYIAEIHVAKHRNGPTGMVRLFFDEPRASFKNLEQRRGL
ncbi:MAG: replicative DNA helicase [Patescibacteria group bacterium]|mgnify:CR=1 FL=1